MIRVMSYQTPYQENMNHIARTKRLTDYPTHKLYS